jgi:hypothetical protein
MACWGGYVGERAAAEGAVAGGSGPSEDQAEYYMIRGGRQHLVSVSTEVTVHYRCHWNTIFTSNNHAEVIHLKTFDQNVLDQPYHERVKIRVASTRLIMSIPE